MRITVTKRDGSKEAFNANQINKSIERACLGLDDPNGKVVQIATETRLMLYDGITTEELDHATINAALQNVQEDTECDKVATRLLLKTVYKKVLGDYEDDPGVLADKHRAGFVLHIQNGVDSGLLDARMRQCFDLQALSAALQLERDELFLFAGLSTLLDRYALKDPRQRPLETPQYFFMRVAMGLSYNEADPTAQAIVFYDKMSRLEYLAGGSTNIGAGTVRPALSNCFLLEIHDDIDHIAKSVADVIKIPLKEDLEDWASLTDDERYAVEFVMAFFNPAELIVNRVLALGVYPYLKSAECHLYLAKQMWEEANHCVGFEYVLETLPIDRSKVYARHIETASMRAKEDYINRFMARMTEDSYDVTSAEGKKDFIRNLVAYNIVMEGIWFYSGFMVMLSFRQRNKLRNFGSMINWVLRDESLHLKFGIQLVLTLLEENSELLTPEFAAEIRDLVLEGVELETAYNRDLFPNGILGLNAEYVNQYVHYVADRRLEELGLTAHYRVTNPAKWMSTATDVYELVNFFEAQNTSYEVDARAHEKEDKPDA